MRYSLRPSKISKMMPKAYFMMPYDLEDHMTKFLDSKERSRLGLVSKELNKVTEKKLSKEARHIISIFNIKWDVKEEDLAELFTSHGFQTKKITVAREGYGFIHFEDEQLAKSALQLDGTLYRGRYITVVMAKSCSEAFSEQQDQRVFDSLMDIDSFYGEF